jgi:L-methionine (R)-S-oxide reductase
LLYPIELRAQVIREVATRRRVRIPGGEELKTMDYEMLERQVAALLDGESDIIANAANFAAFVYQELPELNWAGFYFGSENGDLVLGPFCGKPACTRLPFGRGVCGAAFTTSATVVVDDVGAFNDHIVCDSASQSEVAVPVIVGGRTIGVFDVDAPIKARFSDADRAGIEALVRRFVTSSPSAHAYRPH